MLLSYTLQNLVSFLDNFGFSISNFRWKLNSNHKLDIALSEVCGGGFEHSVDSHRKFTVRSS